MYQTQTKFNISTTSTSQTNQIQVPIQTTGSNQMPMKVLLVNRLQQNRPVEITPKPCPVPIAPHPSTQIVTPVSQPEPSITTRSKTKMPDCIRRPTLNWKGGKDYDRPGMLMFQKRISRYMRKFFN